MWRAPEHKPIMFSQVNIPGTDGYLENWEKHHNLPTQSRTDPVAGPMIRKLERYGFLLDNFGANGCLLPRTRELARKHGLPMHRGGHRRYNRTVIGFLRATSVLADRIRNNQIRIIFARSCLNQCLGTIRTLLAEQRAESVNGIIFPADFAPIDALRLSEYIERNQIK